jgi:ribosomal protein S18 acetylase RimI-like enzyme
MTSALRPAQPADLDSILAIAAASPDAPQWQPSDYLPYLTPEASNPAPSNPAPLNPALLRTAIVAISEEKTQAFAAATLLLIPDSAGAQNLAQLDSIAVLSVARRQGIATALLRALLAWAAANHAHHFSLEVRASNAPAIRLYERLGLRPEGRRPLYYAHPEEDALLLGIPITTVPPDSSFPP